MYKKILFIVVTFLQSISASSQDLFDAVREGNAKRLKDIIESNPDFVNTKDDQGDTPLIWAAATGKYECVIILLSQNNIQVNLVDAEGQTPLMLAAMNGYHKCVDALIGHRKIEVDKQNDGASAITLAITSGHLKCLVSLLKHPEIDLNFKYDNGDTILHTVLKNYINAQSLNDLALSQSTYVAMLKLLLKDPRTDITISNADGDTPLSLIKSCDLKEVFLQKPEKTYIPTETDKVEENTRVKYLPIEADGFSINRGF